MTDLRFDRSAIRTHFYQLHEAAKRADVPGGKLALAVYGEDPQTGDKFKSVEHFTVGDVDGMTDAAMTFESRAHHNVYAPLAVLKPETKSGMRREIDIAAVLGFVVDGDADKGHEAPTPPVPADYVVESSPGNLQHFLFLYDPLPPDEAKQFALALGRATKADCADEIGHVWRVPGCLNWPNAAKLKRGRSPEPQPVRIRQPWTKWTSVYTLRSTLQPHWVEPRKDPLKPQSERDVCPNKARDFHVRLREAGYYDAGPSARTRYIRAAKALSADLGDEGRKIWEDVVCWDGSREDEGEPVTAAEADIRWRDCSSLKVGTKPVTHGSLIEEAKQLYGWTGIHIERPRTAAKMFEGVAPILAAAPPIAPAERLIQSSAEFIANFVAPSYLLDGILQKHFCYALTAATGAGKTAIALRLAVHVALGRKLGERDVERGRVLFVAAENYVDVQARFIASAQHCGFDLGSIDVYFIAGKTKLSEIADQVTAEARALGDLALVVVDTSAATFEGADENSNVDALTHAKRIRSLTELQGNPTVLLLCHPVKSATNDNLVPRGGGALLAEIDGNLCARKGDSSIEVHWSGKFRGMDFTPMAFRLDTVIADRLKDARGRNMPTVLATPIDDATRQVLAASERSDQDVVLRAISDNPGKSYADLAKLLGWTMGDGKPYAVKVRRAAERLAGDGLLIKERGNWVVASRGERELNKLDQRSFEAASGRNNVVSPMPPLPVRNA